MMFRRLTLHKMCKCRNLNIVIIVALFLFRLVLSADRVLSSELKCSYIIQPGDTLSDVLYKAGVTGNTSDDALYGPNGWVEKNKKVNRKQIINGEPINWNALPLGTEIKLIMPSSIRKCPDEFSDTSAAAPASLPSPPPYPLTPPSYLQPVNPMPPSDAPYPPSDEEENASDTLEFKIPELRNIEGLTDLILNRSELTYFRSLESQNLILLEKLSLFSFVLESKVSLLEKMRIYVDYAPTASESFINNTYSVSSIRGQVGKGFGLDLPWDLYTEIAPKIGAWKYSSTLPIFLDQGGIQSVDLAFDRQLDLGFDFELSLSLKWMSILYKHGRDLTLGDKTVSHNSARGKSYRNDFEILTPLTSHITASFHVMNEALKISRGDTSNPNEVVDLFKSFNITDARTQEEIDYSVNYIGLGIGVAW